MDMTRLLRPLSLFALIGLSLAILASVTDRRVNAVAPPEVFLPDYGAALERAARLEITHGLGMSGTRVLSFSAKTAFGALSSAAIIRPSKNWSLKRFWLWPT